jgi:hypothetical protein
MMTEKTYLERTEARSLENGKACQIVDKKTKESVLFVRFSETPTQHELKNTVRKIFTRELLPVAFLKATIRQVETCVTFKLGISTSSIRWN